MPFTNTGGGNHEGQDWIPENGVIVAGIHTNIGNFIVQKGVKIKVKPWDGSNFGILEVRCLSAIIDGIITASGSGGRGGDGGKGGDGSRCGFHTPVYSQWGFNGGNGEFGGGAGGHGGTSSGDAAFTGSVFISSRNGGPGEPGGDAPPNADSSTDDSISMGKGGGGGGGGGGGPATNDNPPQRKANGSGGGGGQGGAIGGGVIKIIARKSIKISGQIRAAHAGSQPGNPGQRGFSNTCDGSLGGAGGSGKIPSSEEGQIQTGSPAGNPPGSIPNFGAYFGGDSGFGGKGSGGGILLKIEGYGTQNSNPIIISKEAEIFLAKPDDPGGTVKIMALGTGKFFQIPTGNIHIGSGGRLATNLNTNWDGIRDGFAFTIT